MSEIRHTRPDMKELEKLGVFSWPIWEKDPSSFPWTYDEEETCYILEGKFRITNPGREPLEFGPGDLLNFPEGLNCQWEIKTFFKNSYNRISTLNKIKS